MRAAFRWWRWVFLAVSTGVFLTLPVIVACVSAERASWLLLALLPVTIIDVYLLWGPVLALDESLGLVIFGGTAGYRPAAMILVPLVYHIFLGAIIWLPTLPSQKKHRIIACVFSAVFLFLIVLWTLSRFGNLD